MHIIFYLNVFRVPNGVAHGAQVNVFHVDVVVTQIDDFARLRRCGTSRPRGHCCFFFRSRRAHNCRPVGILGRVVVAIARALHVRAQNGADPRQRGVQLGVFIDNVRVLILAR